LTDRTNGFTVILSKEYREDDAEQIIEAIRMIKGVREVTMHVSGPCCYSASMRAKSELRDSVHKAMSEALYGEE